ncbi:MAG: hypothetical protein JOZ69_18270, partial [Myxococcales bacterium]|nr:hypothetical protein [Myxococcales bacterium]
GDGGTGPAHDGTDGDASDTDVAPTDGPAGGVCDAPGMVFATMCATTLCHTAVDLAGNLDLGSPGLLARLVDKPASGGPGKLIDSSNPAQSVLLLKAAPNPPFGMRMPFGRAPLNPELTQCLQDWVFAQVAPDGG